MHKGTLQDFFSFLDDEDVALAASMSHDWHYKYKPLNAEIKERR